MSFRGLLRPGQGFKLYKILRREGDQTETGRPTTSALKPIGEIRGIITSTSPTEKEQHKQPGSPKTYTIIQRGTKNLAKARDVLEHEDGRRFLVKGDPKNPGELGHFLVYKVEERDDLQ